MFNFLGDEDEDENAKKQGGVNEQKQKSPALPTVTCFVHFLAVAALFSRQPLSRLKFLKVACLQA